MKYLVISDLHLTKKFNKKKFVVLLKLFESVDQVILNGDFWESYAINFDQFVKSKWKLLFPVLKIKNAIYIIGNHDEFNESDDRANLFCIEKVTSYKLDVDGISYHIEHGHRLSGDKPPKLTLIRKVKYWVSFTEQIFSIISNGFIQKLYSLKDIRRLKKYAQKLPLNEVLVCGHTHVQENAQSYINTGFNRFKYFQYVIIDGKNITFIKEKI